MGVFMCKNYKVEPVRENGAIEICDGNKVVYSSRYPLKMIINSKADLRKNNNSPETALWQAVIIQALEDATSNSNKKRFKLHKRRAREWLTDSNYDLRKVCVLAGVRYNSLLKLMSQLW